MSSTEQSGTKKRSFAGRIGPAIAWRRNMARDKWLGFLSHWKWGVLVRWPLRKPYQRGELRLAAPGGGIGDELMCTPIFAEIKRRNPGCKLTFISRYPEWFARHPQIDFIEPFVKGANQNAIQLAYQHAVPPRRTLISLMAECVGLQMDSGCISAPELKPGAGFRAKIASISAPRIVIQPLASRWTPNKLWPLDYWGELIGELVKDFEVIEVGVDPSFPRDGFGTKFHSFAGTTTLDEFAHAVSQATVFVGPSSGGMHLANAFGIESVIIFGGYESPVGYNNPHATNFFSAVPCAPCWLTSDCPYELKCMKMISPGQVLAAVRDAVNRVSSRLMSSHQELRGTIIER